MISSTGQHASAIAETCRETGSLYRNRPGHLAAPRESRIALCAHPTRGGKTRRLAGGKTAHRWWRQPQRDAQSTHRRRGQYRGRCGPTEATASGNVLVQSIAAGEVAGLAEARQIVRNPLTPNRSSRIPQRNWSPFARFDQLCGNALPDPAWRRRFRNLQRKWCRMGDDRR